MTLDASFLFQYFFYRLESRLLKIKICHHKTRQNVSYCESDWIISAQVENYKLSVVVEGENLPLILDVIVPNSKRIGKKIRSNI